MRPRQVVHRGSVEAGAFLFDPELIGEAAAKARVLSAWVPGALVYATPMGYLLHLPRPIRTVVSTANGLPLVKGAGLPPVHFAPLQPVQIGSERHTEILSSSPLDEKELAQLDVPPFGVVIARGGEACVLVLSPNDLVDVAAWVDVDGWSTVTVAPLGKPPPAPQVRVASQTTSARSILVGKGELAALQPEARQLFEQLANAPRPSAARKNWLARSLEWFHRIFGRLAATPTAAQPRGASRFSRAMAGIQTLLAQLLVRANLATWLGRRQAEYVARLFDMFDRGDLENALRHAIPLGRGDESGQPSPPALSVPVPRSELLISPTVTKASSSLGFGPGLYDDLRSRYRAAVERLERQGRIEEAAFVLAELLGADEEAVAFLERHRRFTLAAELADGRSLAPALRVRQWFLAGNPKKAIQVARKNQAFALAIARLERTGEVESANALRLAFADMLATAGDFTNAVHTAENIPSARGLVERWTDLAIETGGVVGARMLARKVAQQEAFLDGPDNKLRVRFEEILHGEHPDDREMRFAFAEAFTAVHRSRSPVFFQIAKSTLRALWADVGLGDRDLNPVLEKLVDLSEDAVLRADAPATVFTPRTMLGFRHTIAATDRGARPIADAVLLPNGRSVLALFEAGVAMIDRRGKTIAHWDQPASALVLSDHKNRVIAIADRGETTKRLARIDLASRQSEVWCETELDQFARDFDGSTWIVSVRPTRMSPEHELLVLDATLGEYAEYGLEVDQRFQIPGAVQAIARSPVGCEALYGNPPGSFVTRVSFELPSWTLRTRTVFPGRCCAVSPTGGVIALLVAGPTGEAILTVKQDNQLLFTPMGMRVSVDAVVDVATTLRNTVVLWISGSDAHVLIVQHHRGTVVGEIHLEGATSATIRLRDDNLVINDDLGRLFAVSLASGEILRDIRF